MWLRILNQNLIFCSHLFNGLTSWVLLQNSMLRSNTFERNEKMWTNGTNLLIVINTQIKLIHLISYIHHVVLKLNNIIDLCVHLSIFRLFHIKICATFLSNSISCFRTFYFAVVVVVVVFTLWFCGCYLLLYQYEIDTIHLQIISW